MMLSLSYVNSLSKAHAAWCYVVFHGYRVFRLKPDSKQPFPGSRGFEDATDDPDTVLRWWRETPDANIGLDLRGTFAVVDLDERPERDAWGAMSWMEIGGTWDHAHQKTPSGGRHLIFPSTPWLFPRNFTGRGPFGGIDGKTDRGYIVVAPSTVDGKKYEWVDGEVKLPSPAVCETLLGYGSGPERKNIGFPAAEDLTDYEVQLHLATLPEKYRLWLTEGVGWRDDNSAMAWECALQMRLNGWSLERIARIGPETMLGVFGARHPHNASNPWAWAWRYVISAAVGAADAELKRRERVFAALETPSAAPETTSAVALGGSEGGDLERLRQRVDRLPRGSAETHREAHEILRAACELKLGATASENLRQWMARTVPELSAAWVRSTWNTLQAETARERARAGDRLPDVYIKDQAKVLDRASETLVSREAFLIDAARSFGGDKAAAEKHWLTGTNALCEIVQSLTYAPGSQPGVMIGDMGIKRWNTWKSSRVIPEPGDGPGPWLELLDRLDLEDGRDALLDYLAFLVQHPDQKMNHGVLMGGGHGIGKDSLLEPIVRILGSENVREIRADALLENFSGYLAHTKLLRVSEIELGNHKDAQLVSAKMKPILADPPGQVRVNEKNLREYEIPNVIQVIAMTNHREKPLHMDPGERRWACMWCRARSGDAGTPERREQDEWFDRYYRWLDDGGTGAVYAWLLQRDLRGFHPKRPPMKTTWCLTIQDQSRPPLSRWIFDRIMAGEGIWESDVLRTKDIIDDARAAQMRGEFDIGRRTPNKYLVKGALETLGAQRWRIAPGNNGQTWIIRNDTLVHQRGKDYYRALLAVADLDGWAVALAMPPRTRALYTGRGRDDPRPIWL